MEERSNLPSSVNVRGFELEAFYCSLNDSELAGVVANLSDSIDPYGYKDAVDNEEVARSVLLDEMNSPEKLRVIAGWFNEVSTGNEALDCQAAAIRKVLLEKANKLGRCFYVSIPYFHHKVFKCAGGVGDEKHEAFYTEYFAKDGCQVAISNGYLGDRVKQNGSPFTEDSLIPAEIKRLEAEMPNSQVIAQLKRTCYGDPTLEERVLKVVNPAS